MESFRGWNGMKFKLFTGHDFSCIYYFEGYDKDSRQIWVYLGPHLHHMYLREGASNPFPIIKTSARTALKFNKLQGLI